MAVFGDRTSRLTTANVSIGEISDACAQGTKTLALVLQALGQQDPSLHSKVVELKSTLDGLGVSIGEAIEGLAAQQKAETDALCARMPELRSALDAVLQKETYLDFRKAPQTMKVDNIFPREGRVFIQHNFRWNEGDAIAQFTDVVGRVMRSKFPGVAFQVLGNGFESS